MFEAENRKSSYKGLDIAGFALILFGILWVVFFPAPQYEEIGSYSIAQLFPIVMGGSLSVMKPYPTIT